MKKNLTIEETFALAVQNHRKNNLQVAKKLYKKILNINPNDLQSNFLLGTLSAQTKQFDIAKKLINRSIEINPNYADAHHNLGNILRETGEHQKAISSYEKAIQIRPNYSEAHNNLGVVLQELGEYQKAISSYEKAIQIRPNYSEAHNNLGVVLQELGEYQKAKSFYQIAVKNEPENLAHLYNLSSLDEEILHPNLKNKIYEIIEKNNSTKKNIAYGNFLLSRYELKAKKYKNEFDHLLKAHQYYFESENKKFEKGVEYFFNLFSKRKELITLNRYNKNDKTDNHVIKPIFIIGVPRCGSTLIEKIIASGSQYIPIGEETGIIHAVVKNLINQKQSLNLDIDQFQTKIVEIYKQKGLVQKESNYMFTDKSLENFFYIDIIKEIFPQAKVINCRRNAISSIMSTLKNNLFTLPWAHNLEHIFKYYDIYYQMIKNFEKTHSNFIYDLQYEKFVSDPENEAKKLMKFCGLPWDIKCLEFYKRRDLISKTASNIQLRKAIYNDSINKYLPYKQFLSKYVNKYSWFN